MSFRKIFQIFETLKSLRPRIRSARYIFVLLALSLYCGLPVFIGGVKPAFGLNKGELKSESLLLAERKKLEGELGRLLEKRKFLVALLEESAAKLQALKVQAKKGGVWGLPARMRIPAVRAEAQELIKKISLLDKKISEKKDLLARNRKALIRLYSGLLKDSSLDRESRARYRKALLKLRRKVSLPLRPIPKLNLKISPWDSPMELQQKAEIVRDQEERIASQLSKLNKMLRELQIKIAREKKERKITERVRGILETDELFDESERNPRSLRERDERTNLRKKEGGGSEDRVRVQAGAKSPPSERAKSGGNAPAEAAGATGPSASGGGGASSGGKDSAPGGRGSLDSGAAPGSSPPPAGRSGSGGSSGQRRAGVKSSAEVRYPTRPQGQKSSLFPVEWGGPLHRRVENLRRYRRYLEMRLKRLKEIRRKLLQKAKKISKKKRR